jgi:sigma-B regulation protein RsbU (phosphoserine phosphatase)
MEIRQKERALRVAAVLLLILLAAYQVATGTMYYEQIRWPENQAAAGFALGAPWPAVKRPGPAAVAAGLREGDRLLAVQGRPFAGDAARFAALEKLFPGDRVAVTVQGSGGVAREVSWQLETASLNRITISRMVFLALMSIGMPLLCMALGFWTVLLRPLDKQAWLLLAMLVTFSHSVVHPSYFPVAMGAVVVLFQMLHVLCNSAWGLSMFLFAWEFPRRAAWQERMGWLRLGAVAALVASIGVSAVSSYLTAWGDPGRWASVIDGTFRFSGVIQFLNMAAISAFFGLLTSKRFALSDLDSRRRLRIILGGAILALTPMFVVILVSLASGRSPDSLSEWIILPALLAMCLFPVTLAYVIVVHRAFGVALTVRQGLQYALASRGVRILQAALILGILLMAVALATQPGMNRPKTLQVVAFGTILVVFLQKGAEKLALWVDRRFFREAYDAELLLTTLSEDVRGMVETKPLLEAVATRIAAALHVDRIALLVREEDGFAPAYGGAGTLPDGARTAELLRRDRAPLRVYLDDASSWVHREALGEDEMGWLRETGAELLLPLAVKDRLLGVLTLGHKRSEEPYTPNDIRLLETVAAQAGMALENSQLAAAITEAVAQRERLNREVEIAGEVQERLFPQNLPAIAGLDYWGYCRPARGVGGDSYDFLQLENGVFAFSIGDVSGKGIPAALLMASLQSALRGQAMSLPGDLGVMISTLNRLIFDSSPSNRYATLFYAQYDAGTRVLTYVNGGHCPPMVLRGDSIHRLEEGGPVVGLFRPARFTHGTFVIEPGDLLVGFTDGISEAMNAADEEWGEDALGVFLQSHKEDTVRDIIPKIVTAADGFANGHPQHDDMTLIAVRFLC